MSISDKDARAMVRLLGNTAALKGGHTKKKCFLMRGLCQLVSAEAWIWTLSCHINPNERQNYVSFLHEGLSDDEYYSLLTAVDSPGMIRIVKPFFQELADTGCHLTKTSQEVDPEDIAWQSDFKELWAAANVGPMLLSYYPISDNSISSIAVYRHPNDAPFTDSQKQMVHIILGEVPWLHMSGWPEDKGASVPKLFPRQRLVLNLLLDGKSRKQIALQMRLTENTVSGYVKDIFNHFGVNSHVELIRKFMVCNP